MDDNWIYIKNLGNEWDSEEIYVHKSKETVKVYRSECIYWGYHDESEWDKSESIISIESALKLVYPDKVAIYKILSNTKGDYSEVLEELFGTKEYSSELSEIGLKLQKELEEKEKRLQLEKKLPYSKSPCNNVNASITTVQQTRLEAECSLEKEDQKVEIDFQQQLCKWILIVSAIVCLIVAAVGQKI